MNLGANIIVAIVLSSGNYRVLQFEQMNFRELVRTVCYVLRVAGGRHSMGITGKLDSCFGLAVMFDSE